jgi:monoamine oxidase
LAELAIVDLGARMRGFPMARTPLARKLGEAASAVSAEALQGASVDQTTDDRGGGMRRRELLVGGAGLTMAAMLSGRIPRALGANPARIVVVGGGLAGLTCAYRLKQAGYRAELYEASGRLGGRCGTRRGDFAEGQIAEHGGELIDQGHTQTRQLAQELGLNLDNLLAAEASGTDPFYYFDGQPYSFADATDDLKQIWQQLHKDVSAAGYPTLYTQSTQRGRELDAMSIADWITAYVPGGLRSKLGQLLDVAYNIEYGAETNVQSSLNMLYLLGYSGQGQLRIFGPSNEKYHVRGGNDQIPARLANALQGQITTGAELTAIKRNADGTYRLSFGSGSATSTVSADRVVLALPFSILREVDYSKAGFSTVKKAAIEELGMGTNSKLHLQFKNRFWNTLGNQGDTYADTGYQTTWDVTRAQPGPPGSSSTTPAATSARVSAAALRPNAHPGSSPRSSRFCRESPRAGTARRPSTTGRATAGPRAPTPTGRSASTRSSPAPSPRRKAPATSPGSTPRSTSRATSTAPSNQVNGRPARSSRPSNRYSARVRATISAAASTASTPETEWPALRMSLQRTGPSPAPLAP